MTPPKNKKSTAAKGVLRLYSPPFAGFNLIRFKGHPDSFGTSQHPAGPTLTTSSPGISKFTSFIIIMHVDRDKAFFAIRA